MVYPSMTLLEGTEHRYDIGEVGAVMDSGFGGATINYLDSVTSNI